VSQLSLPFGEVEASIPTAALDDLALEIGLGADTSHSREIQP
jgi:hypothetical protein